MNVEPLRRVGRPDHQASEELVQHIVETAARLFIQQGYAATSIEQIAAAAGSGKQTIYRRFVSKEALFIEVINRQGQRLTEMAKAAHATGASPLDSLRGIARLMLDFMLDPEMIGLHRVLIAEVPRFPDTVGTVLENCIEPFQALVHAALREARAAGQIRFDDVEQTQMQMIGLVTGGPLQKTLIGQPPFKTPPEREAYFETAWKVFLHGVS
jgi:AcrR family transcriptional regulator